MRSLLVIMMSTFFCMPAMGQNAPPELVPCKPLADMAARYTRLARDSERTQNYPYDVKYYDLEFLIDEQTELIYGTTTITFDPLSAGLDSILLDFSSVLTVDSIGGFSDSYEHSDNELIVYLSSPVDPGELTNISVSYHGHPEESGFQAFAFDTQAGQPLISTLSEPYGARTWWPCKDMPTDKADSVRITVTVDDALFAVSNGLLQSDTDNGDGTRTFVWKHGYPITTYLVSLAITNYTYWTTTYHFAEGDSMPLEYWVYPSNDNTTTRNRYALTDGMLDAFNTRYGRYPFDTEKYGMAQFPWGGAMEHQTCSSMNPGSVEGTIAHELAHQWWGDMVTCSDFHHIWINEGFATYSEALYKELQYGENAYHSDMAAKDYEYSGSIYRNDTTSVWQIFDYIVYGKGAWVLHMLRHVVGDDDFFQILADYREEFAFSHASTEDFQGVAEAVYGESMEWFFQPWIYGFDLPRYRWWWAVDNVDSEGTTTINVNIRQVQSGAAPVFTMPIDLHFSGAPGNDTVVTVWDSLRSQDFSVELPFTPVTGELDPQRWILRRVTQVASVNDKPLLPGSVAIRSSYPNPFNAGTRLEIELGTNTTAELRIFDLRGRLVHAHELRSQGTDLVNTFWDGHDIGGYDLSGGIYVAQVQTPDGASAAYKLTLLK